MAKYDVKMSCGHTETIQLFGKMTDRDRKIAWLEEHGICSACYKARKDAAHAEETAAAKAKADEENLPELTGSEKQINWALAIRAKKFEALDNRLAEMNSKIADEQQQRKNQIALKATRNVLARRTDSRFWIDARSGDALRLIANNNLQDELKAEFARLTAEADVENNNNNDAIIAAIDDYAVTAEAQDAAVNAEIEAANNNTEEEKTMTNNNTKAASNGSTYYYVRENGKLRRISSKEATRLTIDNILDDRDATQAITAANNEEEPTMTKAAKIAAIQNAIDAVIAERNEAYDELAAAEANEEIAQWFIDQLKENIEDLGNQYWQLVAELDAAKVDAARDEIRAEAKADGCKFLVITKSILIGDNGKSSIAPTESHHKTYEKAIKTLARYAKFRTNNPAHDGGFDFADIDGNIIVSGTAADFYNFISDNDDEPEPPTNDTPETDGSEDDPDENPFDSLPELDELNDVDEVGRVVQPLRQTFSFTPSGNEQHQIFTDDDVVSFFNGKFHHVTSTKYAAWFSVPFCHYAWHTFRDGKIFGSDGTNDEGEFFAEMERRGACSIDQPTDEPPTIDDDDPEPQTDEPAEDVPDTIAAVAETLHDINDHAPDGWEVFYNADGKNYTVTFDDEPVANLDSLALLKVLPPEEFFGKFKSTAEEQFSADRVDEVAALKEMRKQLADDKERLKIIDDLINDATRAAILG